MTTDNNAKRRLLTLLEDVHQHRNAEVGPIGRLLEPREVDAIIGGYCEYVMSKDGKGGFDQFCPPPDDDEASIFSFFSF